jgi:hypothetical protein
VKLCKLRDALIGVALFGMTAAFTLWQNSRVGVLWDLSYLLDSSYRFSLGQIPYKDLPFVHAPGTFLLHAAIIRLCGRVYYPHILCAALEAGAATLLTWRILVHQTASLGGQSWKTATVLAAPLITLGIYAIYPHPIYDSDAILAILVALTLLMRQAQGRTTSFAAGVASALPLFVKQNIGLLFLFAVLISTVFIAFLRRQKRLSNAAQRWLLAGIVVTTGACLLVVHAVCGLEDYFFWTVTFARQRRMPGMAISLAPWHQMSLLWTIPAAFLALVIYRRNFRWTRLLAAALLAMPFLWMAAALALTSDPGDRADQLLSIWPHLLLLGIFLVFWNLRPARLRAATTFSAHLPFVLIATIYGTLLSQQLWGSTYALWPLLILLVACLLRMVESLARPLAVVVSCSLLLCGTLYAVSHERLSYIHLEEPVSRATLPSMRGLATPGPYIGNFENLIRFTNDEIPASDGILLLQGEDPFYFATGRVPRFPILLFDPATDPYTPAQTAEEARIHDIRWLIVKTETQLVAPPFPNQPAIGQAVEADFAEYRELPGYVIYRRK